MTGTTKEYAVALFDLAKESTLEAEFFEGLRFIKSVFDATPDFAAFLLSPGISKQTRLDTIEKAFADSLPEYLVSFLSLLCEQGNIKMLNEIIENYETLYGESLKVSQAVAVSVVELTAKQKSALRKKLEKLSGHEVEIKYEIDSTLLGGMTVYMDGICLDGSLRRQMKNIREVIDE